ncbi:MULTISPECIES: hypothetical protein [unclassified Francisella]|uniref:hypothetical protein n=1 Tax=unclassified Francisella TaxID=2610885 RepID=UPI002E338C0D|nr:MULTISPECIES: hypothetical protein [unclassified Francisella]MED7818885.1 hypothetical protein [Francisella sp. 19S2-4]MED7829722.1 hypothetical protein [Francisella sp. 19S2-10]
MASKFDGILTGKIKFNDLNTSTIEELKSIFNYSAPKSIEDLKFAQLYDTWFASKQMNDYTINGRLQVSLILLNDDLSLNTENVKYLHTSQIRDLNLDLKQYGFSGELIFNVPYNPDEESLWSNLANYQNKFAIELKYQEDLEPDNSQPNPNTQNCWSIRGYIDLTKDNAIELIDQVSNISSFTYGVHYLSCKILFTDIFAFIAKQHYPVKIYPQSTYADVFHDIFTNFNGLVSYTQNDIDIFNNKYNFICVNCDYPSHSFYDFFFSTLRHYQLQLAYDYSSIDPSYSIINLAEPGTTDTTNIELPVGIIRKIVNQIGNYSFSNVNLINQHWADQNSPPVVNLYASSQNILASKDFIFEYPVPSSQFGYAQSFYTNEINNIEKKLKYTNLELCYFPADFTILPKNIFCLPQEYQQILPQYTGNLVICSSKISFKNYNRIAIYAGQTSEYTKSATTENVSSLDYQLNHGLNISIQVCSTNDLAPSFPDFNKITKDLNIYGWIDSAISGEDTIYSVVAANEPDSQVDINKNFTADQTAFLMHDHSSQEISYIVRIPSVLNGSATCFDITLPYFVLHDHAVMPLRRGTPVAISLSQENGKIDKVMWHSMLDQSFDKNSQINKMTFGANDLAGIVHQAENQTLTEGSLEIFSQTSNNKTQFISDKSQMSLIYSEE